MKMHPFWSQILNRKGPVLDPVSRISEVVFGLIMVLTFTGTISSATAGREEVRLLLWAALACNVAWGIVDGFMYIMAILLERGNARRALDGVLAARTPGEAGEIIKEYLPPAVAYVMDGDQLGIVADKLKELPPPPSKAPITWMDVRGALGVFILVFLSTFPTAIPFIFIQDTHTAMRVSNGVALLLLFVTGFYLGRQTGYNPWWLGMLVCVLGVLLVALTIALGG